MKWTRKVKQCAECGQPYDTQKYCCPVPCKKVPILKWRLSPHVSQAFHGSTHKGNLSHALDFAVPIGTPVFAALDGIVVDVVSHFIDGGKQEDFRHKANYVCIRHSNDQALRYTRYFHLRDACINPSDIVSAGQLIGHSGNTGYTSGPHLHFDVVDVHGPDLVSVRIDLGEGLRKISAVPLSFCKRDLPDSTLRLSVYASYNFQLVQEIDASDVPKTSFALVCSRGENSFMEKAQVAVNIGATCLIIVDDDPSMSSALPLLLGDGDQELDLYVLFISYNNLEWLASRLSKTGSIRGNGIYPLNFGIELARNPLVPSRDATEPLCRPKTFPIRIVY